MPDPDLMTAAEAAKALGVTPQTIGRYARSGVLEAVWYPSKRLRGVTRASVERAKAQPTTEPA